jgi:hypothetical protein
MRPAVVPRPRGSVPQPEVRAQIDDLHGGRQRGRERGRLPVRQGEKDQVGVAQGGRVGRSERDVEAGQLRMYGGQRRTDLGVPGGGDQVQLGVPGDQAQQLAAGVPAGTRDRDPNPHTDLRMTMQRTVSTHGTARHHPSPAILDHARMSRLIMKLLRPGTGSGAH